MIRHLIALLLAATTASAGGAAASADTTRVELTAPSSPVELAVEIQWGSIRIRGAAEASAVTIEALADRPDEVAGTLIDVSEEDNRVTVTQAPLERGTFRSAHLDVTVPLRTSVDLAMNRGGDIWVRGVEGLVQVTNLNGSVELSEISGAAAVNASNGSIRAGFAEVAADRDMLFASLNGSVELCLPPTFGAQVHLTTAGDPIRSDFPIERDELVRTLAPGESLTVRSSEVSGRIGSGAALLRASTLNGEIHLGRCG